MTTGMGVTTSASETNGTNVGDGFDGPRSAAAQQLSASTWLIAVAEPEPCPDLCIGQSPPSAQQAFRASGVAAQPAQGPNPPDDNTTLRAIAATRLVTARTQIG
jgi:hypothetical protein